MRRQHRQHPDHPSDRQRQAENQEKAWEAIKGERDRRKQVGVKAGGHWYHSDTESRIQQMYLVMMGGSMPSGIMWKTLSTSGDSVFVEMTPAIAQAISTNMAANDIAVHAVAELHRVAMLASSDPAQYDFSSGWPKTIYDEN